MTVVKAFTGVASVACLNILGEVHAVDGLGKYSGTRGFANTSRSAEQKGLC
jgi:hypothetical protein